MVKQPRIITWDEDAKLYFKAAIKFIKKESAQGAKKVRLEILDTIDLLPENPFLFEEDRFKLNNDSTYRAFVVYHYRITYKINRDSIQILRIRHTSQEPLEY
ncbi:MAG TPA: type II toxin-antitoxin system RelE/ParE family toxin [Bacteroidia bacterium]|jgi:plasmid stabilization system protein ParE|nr:type II toxin-antitoxin system RelE/ParE family toxin [Bacteroidia bacterium]